MVLQKFMYKGKTLEELKSMDIKEFAGLVPARERRALRRGFTEHQKKFLKSIRRDPKRFHRIRCREMIIIPEMVGMKIGVHDGKEYRLIEIRPEMLGHRLGEFALTRRQVKHSAPGFGATKSSKFVPLK